MTPPRERHTPPEYLAELLRAGRARTRLHQVDIGRRAGISAS